jgi:phosphoadenosine phosphosulfate reductase
VTLDRAAALREMVDKAAIDLDGAAAEDVIRWADERLGKRIVVATSLQNAVVIDLAARVRPGIDVLFLDTGYHFAETIGMRDAVQARYPIRMLSVQPGQTVIEQDDLHGKDLFARNPDLCCHLRKVVPLNTMLSMYDGWVTGLRRSETPDRSAAGPIEWDVQREMVKVNPIVDWDDDAVDGYIRDNDILVNPLHDEGYPSIGCAPCTAKVPDGADPRSGRWSGFDKRECGLHE